MGKSLIESAEDKALFMQCVTAAAGMLTDQEKMNLWSESESLRSCSRDAMEAIAHEIYAVYKGVVG